MTDLDIHQNEENRPLRALIVDDEPLVLQQFEAVLASLGYEHISATTGQQALDLLKDHAVSLVVTDIKMPGMDGIELMRQVKEHYPDTEVIVMTGYNQEYTFEQVIEEGAVDYISKPFQLNDLKARLYRVDREQRLIRQLKHQYEVCKEAWAEQVRLEQQLRQAHKLEAIGTLASGIAHDFNNMLNVMMGYAEMLKISLPDESQEHGYARHIKESVKQAANLTKQILTFSRQAKQKRTPLQLSLIVKEAMKLLKGVLPSTISIQHTILDRCPLIMAEPTQMHQVIMNLCTNAYQSMRHKGGSLKVELREAGREGNEELRDMPDGNYLCLTVEDSGEGMDRKTLERIFEPYFTTKAKGEGTGLGLATVHGIVQAHGGTIVVQSSPGQGTLFRIYFPVVEAEAAMAEEEREARLPELSGRVLFVDDVPVNVGIGEHILGQVGCDVVGETLPAKALARFKAAPHEFDLVITDQTMPGLTGIELAAKIFEIRKDVPVIIVTGFSDSVVQEQIQELGITDLIMKPLEFDPFVRSVAAALGKSGPK